MKHRYTTEQIQAAIDAACEDTSVPTNIQCLDLRSHQINWNRETPARLHLAEKLLTLLPEPEPPTPKEIPWIPWHGGECPLKDEDVEEIEVKFRNTNIAASKTIQPSGLRWQHVALPADIIAYRVTKWREGFGPVDWKARAEKAEAELVSLRAGFDRAKESIAEARQKSLSTLRPIAEAVPVPDGCVRVAGFEHDHKWLIDSKGIHARDTHFADIRLPESKVEAPAEVIHDGGEVFPVVPWTPQVGDVVTLKSGGPKMTVMDAHPLCYCTWFADGELYSNNFPSTTLIKA